MDKIKECLKKCRLYNFNSRKGLKVLLNIPDNLDLENIRKEILPYYNFFYLRKPDKLKQKETPEERKDRYLSIEEPMDIYDYRPNDYSKDKYRMLININEKWFKKALKKINKLLSQSLIEKNKSNINYPISYLHSSLKKRSYTTNVSSHKSHKYLLAIDIQNFYPSISCKKVFNFFKYDLDLDNDIAEIYTTLCTCPLDDPSVGTFQYGIGQGLATSPILAFLSNYRMFEYINELALKNKIRMTVYVDDIVFSSDKPINQDFINSLFGIIKRNGLKIKKSKIKTFDSKQDKKVTGLCITKDGKIRVPRSKHEEIKVQYDYLSKKVLSIRNINDYFDFYNLFLKFKGNVQFVLLVEERATTKHINFINSYKDFFIYGVKKKFKNKVYTKENIDVDNYKKFLGRYEKLRKYIDSKKIIHYN